MLVGEGREGDDCVCGGVSNNGGWGLPAKAVDLDPLKKQWQESNCKKWTTLLHEFQDASFFLSLPLQFSLFFFC